MAEIADIVVDCAHPAPVARFWAGALDGYAVAPYDEAELARLRANGIDDPEDDPSVLVDAGPGRPRFFFVRVPEPKTVKNRLHLDVRAADPAGEIMRLTGLGARVIAKLPDWTVLADPEGNEFCVLHT
jgi:glyoxalase superfamily protein